MGRFVYLNLIFFILMSPFAWGYFEPSKEVRTEMNGIKLSDYKGFNKKWRLVTVRYRQDSKEMRFVYANDIAWREMQKLKPDYPDGAVFGKLGIISEPDPAFISSLVPAGAERFQLMVRNKKKYKDTQGWGYALFDPNGNLFEGDTHAATMACAACHNIVPQRSYVFSRPLSFNVAGEKLDSGMTNQAIAFKRVSTTTLPEKVQKLVPKLSTLFSLEGTIKKNAFSGTFDEIIPILIQNVFTTGETSILHVDENHFSLVQKLAAQKECVAPKSQYHILIEYNGSRVRDSKVCQ